MDASSMSSVLHALHALMLLMINTNLESWLSLYSGKLVDFLSNSNSVLHATLIMLWMIQITKANHYKSRKAKASTLSTADGFTEHEHER